MKNIGASVDAKSTQEKEKNINEEKNKEYERMVERVRTFIFLKNMNKKITWCRICGNRQVARNSI